MSNLAKVIAISCGLTIASLSTVSTPIYAQAVSITVSPMVTISQLKGAQSRSSFSISNKSQIPIRTRVYAQDFDYDAQKGFVKISDHPHSANPYLQFSPKELVIPPGGTREVRLNITIPPSKPDGEYRVAVFTEDLTERKITDPNNLYSTIIRPQIASVFLISKGAITPQISAVSLSWNSEGNKPRLLLRNQGQASAYPEVNWKLKQGNTEIDSHSIQGIVLLAGREREIDIKIPTDKKLTPGNYTLVGEIDNKDGKLIPFSLSVNIPAK
jgi:P pilus assembly chaperone PapD